VDYDTLINAAAAVGQVVAAILAVVALIVSLRTARAQMRLSEIIASDQRELMFEQVRIERDSDVLKWTHDCVGVLSECEMFLETAPLGDRTPETARRLASLRQRLSALIDCGRLFFPNSQPDKKGNEKPAAYQGFRQRILSRLVSVYGIISKFDRLRSDERREERLKRLYDLRREFVSEAQLAIDPRRYLALKEMNEIRVKKGLEPQRKEDQDPAQPDL